VVRMLDNFFSFVGFTSMSPGREFSPTIIPSYTGWPGDTNSVVTKVQASEIISNSPMLAVPGWLESQSVPKPVAVVSAEHRGIAMPAVQKGDTTISWNDAKAIAEQHLSDGAVLLALQRLPDRGLYQVRLRRADDWQRTGTLRLLIDIRSGAVIETVNPLAGTGGDRFLASLFPLHSGQFGGAFGRWLMVIAGLLPALFFITGLSTWVLRRRRQSV